MKNFLILSVVVFLTACSAGAQREYKTPSLSGDAAQMSSDTLCYRAATGTKNEAILREIKVRALECEDILATDPLYQGG